MNKQEAIDFILKQLDQGHSREEVAAALSEKMGAPLDLVSKFIAQVAASRPQPAPPTAVSSPAQPKFNQALQNEPVPMPARIPAPIPAAEMSSPSGAQVSDAELEQSILRSLLKSRKQDDIIMELCEKNGMTWEEAQRLVARLASRHHNKLITRQNIFQIPLTLAAVLSGLVLMAASASVLAPFVTTLLNLSSGVSTDIPVIDSTARYSPYYFILGLGLTLGGGVGFYKALKTQFE